MVHYVSQVVNNAQGYLNISWWMLGVDNYNFSKEKNYLFVILLCYDSVLLQLRPFRHGLCGIVLLS